MKKRSENKEDKRKKDRLVVKKLTKEQLSALVGRGLGWHCAAEDTNWHSCTGGLSD